MTIAQRIHLFPFRTQKLSSATPEVVGYNAPQDKVVAGFQKIKYSLCGYFIFYVCYVFLWKLYKSNYSLTSVCSRKAKVGNGVYVIMRRSHFLLSLLAPKVVGYNFSPAVRTAACSGIACTFSYVQAHLKRQNSTLYCFDSPFSSRKIR